MVADCSALEAALLAPLPPGADLGGGWVFPRLGGGEEAIT
jgi:hypothetical protein